MNKEQFLERKIFLKKQLIQIVESEIDEMKNELKTLRKKRQKEAKLSQT